MAQIILDSNNNLIQGDFDNATLNNRTKLQTTTTNATTNVYVVPNGSSTSAGVSVANNSNLTNASKIVMATNGSTDVQIISGVNGSGTYLPMSFYTNNTLAMQIGTNGQITVAATANPAFSAYGNISQNISNNTATKISFNLEEFDTNNNYDSTTNYRFTPTVAGYYQVNLACRYETTTAVTSNGEIYIQLRKNGSAYKRGLNSNGQLTSVMSTSGGMTYLIAQCNAIVYLNGSTDYIEGWFYQNTGQTQTLRADQEISYFQAAMIRSA